MRETDRRPAAISEESAPSLDVVFDALSDRRRRYVLYYLHGVADGVATIEDICGYVLAREEPAGGPEEHHQRVKTTLQHVHLPKLEDLGFVEYDSRSETVRYWRQPALEEWLEHAQHKELPER